MAERYLPRRGDALVGRQGDDIERALTRLSGDVAAAGSDSYTAGDATQWDGTAGPPTTIATALDRLAVFCTTIGLGAKP